MNDEKFIDKLTNCSNRMLTDNVIDISCKMSITFLQKILLLKELLYWDSDSWKKQTSTKYTEYLIKFGWFRKQIVKLWILQKTKQWIHSYKYAPCFCLFFGRNWGLQNGISKLSDLYIGMMVTHCNTKHFKSSIHFIFDQDIMFDKLGDLDKTLFCWAKFGSR